MPSRRVYYAAQTMLQSRYFVPSGSYGDVYGDGMSLDPITGVASILGGITGTVVGSVQQTQQIKRDDSCGTAASYKNKYMGCKKARGSKGAYPDHPGKGPFYSDCRSEYKSWMKYKGICEEGSGSGGSVDDYAAESEPSSGSAATPLILGGVAVLGLIGVAVVMSSHRKES